MAEDEFLVEVAAEGMTDPCCLRGADRVKQDKQVIDGVGHGELGRPRLPMASHVPGQDSIAFSYDSGRRVPLMVINCRPMCKHDKRAADVTAQPVVERDTRALKHMVCKVH
jgi:hypothetical protein